MNGLLLALGLAGVVVVSDGVDGVAAVRAVAGIGPDGLDPLAIESLLGAAPRVLGAGALRHCSSGASSLGALRANAVRGEAALRAGDRVGARDQLDLGIAGLSCLGERVEAPVAARLFLVRGALLAQAGDLAGARAELQSALSFSPGLAWDAALPAEGEAVFSAVAAEEARVRLTVAPANEGAGAWVDGQRAAPGLSLRPGLHLVQIPSTGGLRSAWLTLDGEATLVIPANFRRPVLERLGDPARRAEVEALLRATTGATAVYAAAGGGLWLVSEEAGQWSTTVLAAPPPAEGRRR